MNNSKKYYIDDGRLLVVEGIQIREARELEFVSITLWPIAYGKVVDEVPTKRNYKKRVGKGGPKICGICGEPGHMKKTCPKREVKKSEPAEVNGIYSIDIPDHYPITDPETINKIWALVDEKITETGRIAARLGLVPSEVHKVLMQPRP